jgi:hypothetical protein
MGGREMTGSIDVDITQDPADVEVANVPVTSRNRITAPEPAPDPDDIMFDGPCSHYELGEDPC